MSTLITSMFRRDEPPRAKPLSTQDQEFLSDAHERFRLAEEATTDIRRDALDDFRFFVGEQWDSNIYQQRYQDGRPCLTMNRLRQFRRMVTNEQRQQRPAIQINPVGDGADIETGQMLQGLCRHIEVNSDADIAYDTAYEHMATGGFGFWRIITDYVNDDSDEQEIFIKRIKNPFSVYFDPRAAEADYSDALFCFIIDDMPYELYRETYSDSQLASLTTFTGVGDKVPGWITKEAIRVAEYFYIELDKKKKGKREIVKRKVRWAKINGIEILEERDVPGNWIPVIPVLGDDTIVDGKRNLVGMIRDAKDPQRQYNYFISASAEAIALAPKSPFVIAEGQIENHETEWEQSNRRNTAALVYKAISIAGQPVGAPQRNAAEPPIQAMAAMIRQADNDLKATTGIYDASLGQQGPEQSGKAVLARQKQSDIANLNFIDNLARSIRHTGRILLTMIPVIWDTPRIQRIIKPDGTVQQVGVYNSAAGAGGSDGLEELQAMRKIFDIGVGRYDVSVSVGPSYQSKRQEAVASQVALIQSFPQIMGIAGDLLVKNMDWPGAQEISDRLKKTLPPQLQDQDMQQAQSAQQQASQLQAQNQQLTMMVQNLNQIVSQKLVEAQSKTNIALIDQETKINVAKITASKDRDTASADRELALLEMAHDAAHDSASQAADQTHETNQNAMQQAHERGMAAADQAHQQTMAQMQPQPGAAPATPGAPAPGEPEEPGET
jgi:hypothetical protein